MNQEQKLLQDLHDLLEDEIEFVAFVEDDEDTGFGNLCLGHGWAEVELNVASLEDETFFIVQSESDEFFPGCTIEIFELIDLLLERDNRGW